MLAQNFIAILALALTVSASPLVIRQIFDDDTFGDIFDFSSNGDGEGNQEIVNEGQNSSNNVVNSGDVGGDFTVNQSIKTCGNSQINCCNQVEKKGDTINAGLLGSVFGSGDIGVQCSPINVAVLGGTFTKSFLDLEYE